MKENDKTDLGIILLAAGQGSRMGMPKQLLVYDQEPLILHVLNKLKVLKLPITVVLGARAALIKPVLQGEDVTVIVNSRWEEGMGGSMQAGLNTHRHRGGVLLCVVDQPFLSREVLQNLVQRFQRTTDERSIIAARYQDGTLGVPAIFGAHWFEQLLSLPPKVGARKLIRANQDKVLAVDFSAGNFDLDRPEDWENFRGLAE